MSVQLNIGIAGAGIMGRLLAWQLVQAGHTVTVFDKDAIDTGNAAAYTAAGMLTPYSEVESAELLIYQLGMQSLSLWPQIARSLGSDLGLQTSGSLIVAHPNDRADHQRFNQQVLAKLTPSSEQFQSLDRRGLQQLEPELAERFNEATYLPEEAWLCTQKVMSTLAEKLIERGVQWKALTHVNKVSPHEVITEDDNFRFDWVIDTRGLGAKPQWQELRGVRGELIWLQAPEVNINRLVRLMHPRYRLYLVPQLQDDLYIIGATQIESDDKGPITVRSTLELLSAVYALHPGFAEARVLETKTNCRPALNDNLPRIEYQPGLIRINGLYRHGFLLAPSLSNEVVQWLAHRENYQSQFKQLIQKVA